MALELTGKVFQVLPLETGEGKNGQWKKQFFILDFMEGNYPKKVSISAWGEKTDLLRNLLPGAEVKVSFNVESREYNGKWYTDVKAWRIELQAAGSSNNPPTNDIPPFDEPAMASGNGFNGAAENDLPF